MNPNRPIDERLLECGIDAASRANAHARPVDAWISIAETLLDQRDAMLGALDYVVQHTRDENLRFIAREAINAVKTAKTERKLYWFVTLVANVYIGGVAKRETRKFETKEQGQAWASASCSEFGGFPIAYFEQAYDISEITMPPNRLF